MFFKKLIFLQILASASFLSAVTINGEDINKFTKLGDTLSYTARNEDNIAIRIKDGNIELGSIKLINIDQVKKDYKEFYENKDLLAGQISIEGDTITKSEQFISIGGGYISAGQSALLDAPKINIDGGIIEAKNNIIILTDEIKSKFCFVDTVYLQIEPKSDNSFISAIRFEFDKAISVPHSIEGSINLAKNETDIFLVVGARKVSIQFSEKAFEN